MCAIRRLPVMSGLGGRVAVVTDATSGIWRASAILFPKLGSRVIRTGRSQERESRWWALLYLDQKPCSPRDTAPGTSTDGGGTLHSLACLVLLNVPFRVDPLDPVDVCKPYEGHLAFE